MWMCSSSNSSSSIWRRRRDFPDVQRNDPRLRARAAAACISADWSEHPFRCHMLEGVLLMTSLSFLCIKNAKARSPTTMDLRSLREAAAEEDVRSMADDFDQT